MIYQSPLLSITEAWYESKNKMRKVEDDAMVDVEAVPICRTWVNTTRK